MTAYALESRGLRKTYGAVRAVESFDVAVPAGAVLGFLGPNGAGKTTVIRMLSTVLRPDAGTYTVAGVPSSRPDEVRRQLGVLPESAGYPLGQTGHEWLTFHGQLFGQRRSRARATATRLLGEVGLSDRAGAVISTYSRGMRQRLGVARALVNDPVLVILDEPTLGLDPSGQQQLLALVRRISRERGVTVLLSTHLLAEVEDTCDRVLILHRGRVVAEGTVAEVVSLAAAPRQARLQVPTGQQVRARQALQDADDGVDVLGPDAGGTDLRLTLPSGAGTEPAVAGVLRALLDADVTVRGFTLEGGRLSDAFLAVTEAQR